MDGASLMFDNSSPQSADDLCPLGLAMECANTGDAAAADENFQAILGAHPEYRGRLFSVRPILLASDVSMKPDPHLPQASHSPPHRRRSRSIRDGSGLADLG